LVSIIILVAMESSQPSIQIINNEIVLNPSEESFKNSMNQNRVEERGETPYAQKFTRNRQGHQHQNSRIRISSQIEAGVNNEDNFQ